MNLLALARSAIPKRPDGRPEAAANDHLRRIATPAESTELMVLIQSVLAGSPDEWPEVHRIAVADPESALICFQARAAAAAPPPPDRFALPTCQQCGNLTRNGRCLAAGRGELPYVASKNYSPTSEKGRRCEGFLPQPGDADQRPGMERWPNIDAAPKDRI